MPTGFPCTLGDRVTRRPRGDRARGDRRGRLPDRHAGRGDERREDRPAAASSPSAAIVTEGTEVPPGSVVMGQPAKVKRQVTEQDLRADPPRGGALCGGGEGVSGAARAGEETCVPEKRRRINSRRLRNLFASGYAALARTPHATAHVLQPPLAAAASASSVPQCGPQPAVSVSVNLRNWTWAS